MFECTGYPIGIITYTVLARRCHCIGQSPEDADSQQELPIIMNLGRVECIIRVNEPSLNISHATLLRYSRTSIIRTVTMTVLLEYFVTGVCSIRVVQQSSVYKSMGFIYPNKFTYLNTFVIQLTHRCSDNGGPTVSSTKVKQL